MNQFHGVKEDIPIQRWVGFWQTSSKLVQRNMQQVTLSRQQRTHCDLMITTNFNEWTARHDNSKSVLLWHWRVRHRSGNVGEEGLALWKDQLLEIMQCITRLHGRHMRKQHSEVFHQWGSNPHSLDRRCHLANGAQVEPFIVTPVLLHTGLPPRWHSNDGTPQFHRASCRTQVGRTSLWTQAKPSPSQLLCIYMHILLSDHPMNGVL